MVDKPIPSLLKHTGQCWAFTPYGNTSRPISLKAQMTAADESVVKAQRFKLYAYLGKWEVMHLAGSGNSKERTSHEDAPWNRTGDDPYRQEGDPPG